ncbi:hypothetical protein B0H11DRAFT_1914955 [Mycena galericulata]|nr:hypothetical protein B0H11DRAFT_1914955 [Mycena galericulata]
MEDRGNAIVGRDMPSAEQRLATPIGRFGRSTAGGFNLRKRLMLEYDWTKEYLESIEVLLRATMHAYPSKAAMHQAYVHRLAKRDLDIRKCCAHQNGRKLKKIYKKLTGDRCPDDLSCMDTKTSGRFDVCSGSISKKARKRTEEQKRRKCVNESLNFPDDLERLYQRKWGGILDRNKYKSPVCLQQLLYTFKAFHENNDWLESTGFWLSIVSATSGCLGNTVPAWVEIIA